MNPFRIRPLCERCDDHRRVITSSAARESAPCPACGLMTEAEYESFRIGRWKARRAPTTLTVADLDDAEFKTMLRFEEETGCARITALGWIEGQRYDPSTDPVFVAQVEVEMNKWRKRGEEIE